jgi:hypothetical protein
MRILFLLFLILISSASFSMELGNLMISGSGCFGSSRLIAVNKEEGRYALPIRAKVNKAAGSDFDRKSCNLRLPVSLGNNEKVQIVNLSQVIRVVANRGTEIKSDLNISFAGKAGRPLSFETLVVNDDTSVIENLKSDGVVAESNCGKDAMLTGNLSMLVNGNSAQAFVSTGTALLTLKVVSCNQ